MKTPTGKILPWEFCISGSENALPHLLTYDLKILGNCPPNAINSVVCPSANLRQKFGEVRETGNFSSKERGKVAFSSSSQIAWMQWILLRDSIKSPLLLNILFLVSLWAPICSSREFSQSSTKIAYYFSFTWYFGPFCNIKPFKWSKICISVSLESIRKLMLVFYYHRFGFLGPNSQNWNLLEFYKEKMLSGKEQWREQDGPREKLNFWSSHC